MWKYLLILFSFINFSQFSSVKKVFEEFDEIQQLVNEGKGNIGKFTPFSENINISDLNSLSESLKSRTKRQTSDPSAEKNLDESNISESEEEIESTLQTVEVPLQKGNSAFHIQANTVYILYPALFQDPNIFGRFIMPQNINMDSMKNKFSAKEDNRPKIDQAPDFKQNAFPETEIFPPIANGRRSSDNSERSTDGPRKRNVENSLSGSIVVLNQDVNENNKNDSY